MSLQGSTASQTTPPTVLMAAKVCAHCIAAQIQDQYRGASGSQQAHGGADCFKALPQHPDADPAAAGAAAMTATPSRIRQKLKPGAVVRCRTRRYLVEDVQAPLGACCT